jgi:hypothetical protein
MSSELQAYDFNVFTIKVGIKPIISGLRGRFCFTTHLVIALITNIVILKKPNQK